MSCFVVIFDGKSRFFCENGVPHPYIGMHKMVDKGALFEFFHMAKNSILAKIQVLTKYIGAHELGQGRRNSDSQSGSICFHLLA